MLAGASPNPTAIHPSPSRPIPLLVPHASRDTFRRWSAIRILPFRLCPLPRENEPTLRQEHKTSGLPASRDVFSFRGLHLLQAHRCAPCACPPTASRNQ